MFKGFPHFVNPPFQIGMLLLDCTQPQHSKQCQGGRYDNLRNTQEDDTTNKVLKVLMTFIWYQMVSLKMAEKAETRSRYEIMNACMICECVPCSLYI
jgi:hypothetical protein